MPGRLLVVKNALLWQRIFFACSLRLVCLTVGMERALTLAPRLIQRSNLREHGSGQFLRSTARL
jgi:hypothetical protein